MVRSRLLGVVIVAVSSLSACGGGGGGGGTPQDSPSTVTRAIGSDGGTVALPSGPSLDLPGASLATTTSISITRTSAAPPAGALSPIYEFGPSGTTFATPVTVKFPVPAGTSDASIYWTLPGSTTEYDSLVTTVTSGIASAQVTHFSLGLLGAPCASGAACTPANDCHEGVTTCNRFPACSDTGAPVMDGTACGVAGTCTGGTCVEPLPPEAPTGVSAVPGNGSASVSWSASAGATGYRVYHSSSPGVTANDGYVAASGTSATVPSLSNGSVRYFAVSARNAAGESALSPVACAVPSYADPHGLTLYDALCDGTVDGRKWVDLGPYSVGVSGGAAVLSVDVADMEPFPTRGTAYTAWANVASGANRVTTLSASVSVPSLSAARSGSARIRAGIRNVFQPPALRLVYPGANLDFLSVDAGLMDTGDGLVAYRQVMHCDDASCANQSATGIAFVDPEPFATVIADIAKGAPAAYDTVYTVTVGLDEGTGLLHWSISGGSFGAGVSGTADPAAYLAATGSWSGVPLAGSGYKLAQLMARADDPSVGGGGAGRISARFDDVQVGLNGGAAAPFDDFGGAGGNSGPAELSPLRWNKGGASRVLPSGGSLVIHSQTTSPGTGGSASWHSIAHANPTTVNTIMADVTIAAASSSGGVAPTQMAYLSSRLYNDGSPGTSPPHVNQPYSAVGDVMAFMMVHTGANQGARFWIQRCDDASCSANTKVGAGSFGVTNDVGVVRTLYLGWDPETRLIWFGTNGTVVSVDPQVAGTGAVGTAGSYAVTAPAPWAGPPRAPRTALETGVVVTADPTATGASAAMTVKFNNVYTWP